MPPLPAPPRPGTALPSNTGAVYNQLFQGEFDALPVPNRMQATGQRLLCNSSNMEYLRCKNPVSVVYDHNQFFERMARHQWRVVTGPSAAAQAAGMRGMVRPMGGHRDQVANPAMQDQSRPRFGLTTGWNQIPGLMRVNAYAFRGEKRRPEVIRTAGGFQPPSMRTDDHYVGVIATNFAEYMQKRFQKTVDPQQIVDYIRGQGKSGRIFMEYEIWRALLKNEEMHIGKMVANEFLKGYISTSRDVDTAKYFLDSTSEGGQRADGAVYVVHTDGGFMLPDKTRTKHAHGSKMYEAEIAHPGPLPWAKVVAFRPYNVRNLATGVKNVAQPDTIYMRRGFKDADLNGFHHVFNALGSLATD